jgi:hypothetical protein
MYIKFGNGGSETNVAEPGVQLANWTTSHANANEITSLTDTYRPLHLTEPSFALLQHAESSSKHSFSGEIHFKPKGASSSLSTRLKMSFHDLSSTD